MLMDGELKWTLSFFIARVVRSMLKVSKAERVKYPKECAWCGQPVQYGPFTHGKVKDTDTNSVLLHGDLATSGSCAYKFVQGQLPLPVESDQSGASATITIAPKPDIEDYVIILRDDIARVDARIRNMEDLVDSILNRLNAASVVVHHPANEVE